MTDDQDLIDRLDDQISIKLEPELRHVLAHLYYAIECLIKKCPHGAMDNIKGIEGLIMFEGDDVEQWEQYYLAHLERIKQDGKVPKEM